MTRRLSDADRIAGLREVIEAANGDWHEATNLWSVCADLDWLLAAAALPSSEAALFRFEHGHFASLVADSEAVERAARALHERKGGGPFGVEGDCECMEDAAAALDAALAATESAESREAGHEPS